MEEVERPAKVVECGFAYPMAPHGQPCLAIFRTLSRDFSHSMQPPPGSPGPDFISTESWGVASSELMHYPTFHPHSRPLRHWPIRFGVAILGLISGLGLCATEPEAWPALTFHAAPKPLPAGAVTHEWPRFLGPEHAPRSTETKLTHTLPAAGPALVWEVAKGSGYTCPAIAGGKLILFHRVEDHEVVECLHPETGRRFWTQKDPVTYRDRYGYGDGPRASPMIDDGRVYTFGVTSRLTCRDLSDGRVLWQRDCAAQDGVPQYFFGSGATPLAVGEVLVCDLGGKDGKDIVGFDKKTGAVRWTAKTGWGQSYAAPIPAVIQGQPRVLIFQGGEGAAGETSQGGLVCLDPVSGKVDSTFPWRAPRYTSVNAASPVICGPDRVFITQAYVDRGSPCNGGAMLAFDSEHHTTAAWKSETFGCHWMTPVLQGGHLYAFSGEKEDHCDLVCYEATHGRELWRKTEEWKHTTPDGREIPIGLKRASLLAVDGQFLALSEWGSLCWMTLTPEKEERHDTCQLFLAQHAGWTLPALSRGLLYVVQNEPDTFSKTGRRLLCYDLRAEK
jgi:outer membrane protein assembly factor BamB